MPSIINSDDGAISGSSGLETTGGNDGVTVFQQNGVERMRIGTTGNVGIGTSSPTTKLNIVDASATVNVRLESGSVIGQYFASSSGGGVFLDTASSHPLVFRSNSTERMRISSAGAIDMAATSSLQKNSTAAYLLKNVVYLTSGTGATYTTPTGVRALKVVCLGGGGGGGGTDGQGSGTYTVSGSGRGGNAVSMFITSVAASYTYTIGGGGAGGAAGNNDGITGGSTTFGDGTLLITAGGGGSGDGTLGSPSQSGTSNASTASSVSNGNATVQYINGTVGVYGRAASAVLTSFGISGTSPLYGGGKVALSSTTGPAADTYGEGGGSVYAGSVTTNYAGGAGFQGIIVIEEYY
jgi:hypothetical protein